MTNPVAVLNQVLISFLILFGLVVAYKNRDKIRLSKVVLQNKVVSHTDPSVSP